MKKMVVTGGAGFIGSYLARELARSYEVTVVDKVSKKFTEPSINVVIADVYSQKQALKKAFKDADAVFHLAAMVGVTASMDSPQKAIEVNELGTLNVLQAAVENSVEKLVFASSAAVYGNNSAMPIIEESQLKPESVYALNKLHSEHLLDIFSNKIDYTALRLFNVYGPGQSTEYAAVIPVFIQNALQNKPLEIYGDGTQTRDFVYVEDVVSAFILAQTKAAGQKINIATGTQVSVNELSEKILGLTNPQNPVKHLPAKNFDVKHSCASIDKAKKLLGFQPKTSLDQGLKKIVEYYKR